MKRGCLKFLRHPLFFGLCVKLFAHKMRFFIIGNSFILEERIAFIFRLQKAIITLEDVFALSSIKGSATLNFIFF